MKKSSHIKVVIIMFSLALISLFVTLAFTMFDDYGFLSTDCFTNAKLSCFGAIVLNISFIIYYYNYNEEEVNIGKKKIFISFLVLQVTFFAFYFAFKEDIYFLGVKSRVYWLKKENYYYLKSLNDKKIKGQSKPNGLNRIKPSKQAGMKWMSLGRKHKSSAPLLIDNNIYLFFIAYSKGDKDTCLIYSPRTQNNTKLAIKNHFNSSEIVILKKTIPNWYLLILERDFL